MSPDQLTGFFAWMRDLGTAGAVIFTMLTFLKYVRTRDEAMQKAFEELTSAVEKLTAILNVRDK